MPLLVEADRLMGLRPALPERKPLPGGRLTKTEAVLAAMLGREAMVTGNTVTGTAWG